MRSGSYFKHHFKLVVLLIHSYFALLRVFLLAYIMDQLSIWLFQAAFFISIRSIAALEVLGWVDVNRVLDWILGHGSMIFCQGALDWEFGE